MSDLGRIAYDCFARLSGIAHQRDKNSLSRDHAGPMPWEKVPQHIRARWERFAQDFVGELRVESTKALHEELRRKGATLDDERVSHKELRNKRLEDERLETERQKRT